MAEKSMSKPLTYFGVEVTKRCNLRCPHCFTNSTGKAHPGRTAEELRRLIDDLVDVGATHIAFSGGEPLLRKDLEEVMRHGRERGIKGFSLVTNGFLASPQRVKSLREAGLGGVQVSVDGVDAQDHCEVRRCSPVAFYRALGAIRLFREAGMVVDVATIISPTNVDRAPEMVLLCEALGVRSLRYCSFVPTGRAVDAGIARRFACSPARLDSFLEFLRMVKREQKVSVGVLIDHGIGPWQESGAFRCDSGEAVCYISSEGDLYPCPGLIYDPFKVGNVFQTPIAELLASPALSRVRHIGRGELGDPCASCDNDRCSGGCRGAAFAISGSELAAPVYCNVLRRRT
jgi:radical SAM protein with 4Fe4S-binding SPASM domain